MPSSAADIVILQESKLAGENALHRMRAECKASGWKCTASSAHRTAADKASGGCVIAVKGGHGIQAVGKIKDGYEHRVLFSWTSAVLAGGLHIGSVWLRDSEGLTEANMYILKEIAAVVQQLRGPWILAGDWNLTPEILASSNFLKMIGGTVVAPDCPTCNGSAYDYFVICRGLIPAVQGVYLIGDAGYQPHYPVRLVLRGDGRRFLIRQLVRPKHIPGLLPFGPLPEPVHLPNLADVGQAALHIDDATESWYKAARAEWRSLNWSR